MLENKVGLDIVMLLRYTDKQEKNELKHGEIGFNGNELLL